jgi:hypothetical protein
MILATPARGKLEPDETRAGVRNSVHVARGAADFSRMPAPKVRSTTTTSKKPLQRRDGGGHIDAHYGKSLRRLSGSSGRKQPDRAFLNGAYSTDVLAEELGEEFVRSATSGEYEGEEALNQMVPEDIGGPFVTVGGDDEDE